MCENFLNKFNSFYFIGIGGVSMSGLANYLLLLGKKVGGSDISSNDYTQKLISKGVDITFDNTTENIKNYDIVIYTDAVKDNNVFIVESKKQNKPIISRGLFLGEVSKSFKNIIAIAGCHGKTTCTAMLAHILYSAKKRFASHIGGNDLTLSNFFYCGHDYFITEACEYKKNFLTLNPNAAIVLNSDVDHLECYDSELDLHNSYIKFLESANIRIGLFCDLKVENLISFGFDNLADYNAKNIVCGDGVISFNAYEHGNKLGNIKLSVYGKHNVLNALAAIATARSFGFDFDSIKNGLQSFCGVERRFEKIGEINGAVCIADYAHHPNELRAVIRTAKKNNLNKLYVIFQPHTYSRTKSLFKEFVKVLSPLSELLIYKTFAAREYFDDAGSGLTLSLNLKRSCYGDNVGDIVSFLQNVTCNDKIIFLGAGDIYSIAKNVIKIMN